MRKRLGLRHYAGLTAVVALAATTMVLVLAGGASAIVAGAGYSTSLSDATCIHGTTINCNAYAAKTDVYVSGGPTAGGITTAGDYYFAILDPGAQNGGAADGDAGNLSSSASGCVVGDTAADRTFTVGLSGGNPIISDNLGTHASDTNADGKPVIQASDFCDTANNGGVYILAICAVGYSDASHCKYDAFKVRKSTEDCPPESIDPACSPDPFGVVSGQKYFDANHNGRPDPGEAGIANWPINYHDGISGTVYTDGSGNFSLSLLADDYNFAEQQSAVAGWSQTGPTALGAGETPWFTATGVGAAVGLNGMTYDVTVTDNSSISGLLFGNVCTVGNTGGLTLGFWSNKNGQAILAAHSAWLGVINGLHLVGPTSPKKTLPWIYPVFGQYSDFRTWILNATATNASYMLSAQLAATVLNVNYGTQSTSVLVKVVLETSPGVFTTTWEPLSQAITEAMAFLATHKDTTASGVDRDNALMYKDIFDGLNNNLLSVTPPTAGGCLAPGFAAS